MMNEELKNQQTGTETGMEEVVDTGKIAASVDRFLDQFDQPAKGKMERRTEEPRQTGGPKDGRTAGGGAASGSAAASAGPSAKEPDAADRPDSGKRGKKRLPDRIGFRILVCAMTVLVLLTGTFFGAVAMINYGPSKTVRDLFVTSVLETSAAKFLATMYFSDKEIDEIKANNQVVELEEVTDTSLIEIDAAASQDEENDIVIEDVSGPTFKGKMMIVKDPGRLFVGTSIDKYDKSVRGKTVQEIIERYDGVAGVNAGGFVDENGKGDGSIPLGIVISQGQLKWGSKGGTYEIIGFDYENKFVIGKMTGQEALDMGIRDAVSFGPLLIVNGQVLEVKGFGGGLNPRTAIGQRADGSILILVCDGRQGNSLGASMSDVIDLMVEYGAVNAANLDGGSSTVLYHEGELLNVCCSLYGPRDMPTAFVVKALEGGEA